MTFEVNLLRAAFKRCLMDGNNCAGDCAPDDDECDCAVEMQAYLDEAREALVGSGKAT